jgi:hypothetical protein
MPDLEISDADEPAYVRQWHARSCPPQARAGIACVDLGPAELGTGYVGALAVLTSLPVAVRRSS